MILLFEVWCLFGCRPADLDTGPAAPLHEGTPILTDTTWSCDREAGTWEFEVQTEGWTANGDLFMATEEDYLEIHPIRSVEAASDGSWDRLSMTLSIASDWREVSPGSSTAFFCTDPVVAAISFRLFVYSPGTGAIGDCWSFGADPTLFERISDVPACEEVMATPAEAG